MATKSTSTKKTTTTKKDVGAQGIVNNVISEELQVNNDATEFKEETIVVSENPRVEKTVQRVDWIHRHI